MHKKLLEKLCCPFDKNELEINIFNQTEEDIILEGLLNCKSCKRYYPIVYSIPIMSPDEYRQKELEGPILQRWGLMIDKKNNSFILDNKSTKKLNQIDLKN